MTQYGNVTYTYGADGVRKSKGNTEYIYDGDKLLAERWGSQEIEYIYGMDGIIGFLYSGIIYYYKKNLQGDVIEVKKYNPIAETVSTVARYVYDAYGNHKILLDTNGIGTLNPIRYRGYYYDVETGLYYLINRYYDPEIGRFISPDNINYLQPDIIGGINLYSYCLNNPCNKIDVNGFYPVDACYPNTLEDLYSLMSFAAEFSIGSALATASWSAKAAVRPNNIGPGTFKNQVTERLSQISKYSKLLSKVSSIASIASIGVSVYERVQIDIARNYSTDRIISNAVVNTGVYGGLTFGIGLAGAQLGGLVGSVAPGLGNVIGAVVGFGLGMLFGYILDIKINGKSIIDHIGDAVYYFWTGVFE